MTNPFRALVVVLVTCLATANLFAKNATVGIYAIVDHLTLEPDGSLPNAARICGLFVVPVPMSSGSYRSPQRGCLYFKVRRGMENATRKDWEELKALAGTGQVVGFTQYWEKMPPDPRDSHSNKYRSLEVAVHKTASPARAIVYPLPNSKGILKHRDDTDPDYDLIAEQLRKASQR